MILIKFCKCIDIDIGKGQLQIIFCYFSTELWPLIDVRILFPFNILRKIDGFWWNFVYAVLWLAYEIFLNFSAELWPLIDVKISIFRNN